MEQHRRTKNMTETEKEIEVKINQYAMLSNTIQETLRKEGIPKERINVLQEEADKTLMEINALRKKSAEEKECGVNLFDSITKVESDPPHNVKKCCTTLENVMYSNRFLVKMNGFNIPEHMITSVDYCDADVHTLHLKIYDFITSKKGAPVPVASILLENPVENFCITVDYLDVTGRVMYREIYTGCYIVSVIKSSLDHTLDEPRSMLVKVHYKDIQYETTL